MAGDEARKVVMDLRLDPHAAAIMAGYVSGDNGIDLIRDVATRLHRGCSLEGLERRGDHVQHVCQAMLRIADVGKERQRQQVTRRARQHPWML